MLWESIERYKFYLVKIIIFFIIIVFLTLKQSCVMSDEYLRFLNLLKALDGPLTRSLDASSVKLLEIISIEAKLHQRHFTVNDLLAMKDIGSQASIHKKLHSLVDAGYITLETQEDARVKKVLPTQEAKRLFSQVNKLFVSVLKKEN